MTISHMEQRGFYAILLTATLLHVSERSLVEAQFQAQVAKKCTKSWFYDCMEDWDRVPGSWGEWTQVSSCSTTCGNGTKTQARKCSRGSVHYLGITYTNIVSCDGTIVSPGSEEDWNMTTTEYATTSCETKRPCPCPKGKFSVKEGLPHISCGLCPAGQGYTCLKDWDRVPGSWTEWDRGNCYATCGFGTMTKTRHCSRGSVTKGDITLEHAVSCDGTVVGLDNHVNPKNDWETKTIGCDTGTLCPCHNKTLSERLGDKFHVHWKYMNYQDAAQKCKDDGFTLAMPKTLEKQQEMMNQIRHDTQGESSETRFWIGFTGSSNGGFTWADGESVGWTNWWTNQPNSGSKSQCGEIVTSASYSWNDNECSAKRQYFICQEVSVPPTTTPSINDDVIIGVVAGVAGLLLVASIVMIVYKKRQEEEQQKMAMERERADMEMEIQMAEREMERQVQLEQQRAMEMEGQYSASMESLAREVDSLRMKDIHQQQKLQQMEKTQDTGLVKQISSLMFGESTAQGQSPSRHSVQQSRSRPVQDRRHSRHSPSRLSAQHPGRGHSPSRLMVDPSQTPYNPRQF